jgi:hypothetical protein
VPVENVPAGHCVAEVAPGPVAYDPAGAGVHGVSPDAEYDPGEQSVSV